MKPTVFIIDPDKTMRNMVVFHLYQATKFSIQDFHSMEEANYQIRKNICPDYAIIAHEADLYPVRTFINDLLSANPLCRIIVYSHFEHQNDAEQLLEWGATDYISKTGDQITGIRMLVRNIVYLNNCSVRIN
jgi:DNA-binding NtrC family response regulator